MNPNFTDTHLDRLETSLFDKNGKPALKWICSSRNCSASASF